MQDVIGSVAPGFDEVREVFEENFATRGEVGAGVAALVGGYPVVDLWGGVADPATSAPWQRDTVVTLASTSKAMAVISVLHLVELGKIDLDRPIAKYWPEFGSEDKRDISVRMVLTHRSGVVTLDHAPVTYDGLRRGTPVFDALASATPQWTPDTAHGYHGLTIGHLLSAVVRDVTGLTVGRYFAAEIAEPLGLDCYLGLPESELPRLASLVMPSTEADVRLGSKIPGMEGLYAGLSDPESLTYRAFYGSIAFGWEAANDPKYACVEAPSTDGTATAMGLATMFAATIGTVNGIRLFGTGLVREAGTPYSSGEDRVLGIRTDWGLGFGVPGGPLLPHSMPKGSFGHGGSTGSFAFADPSNQLAFGYTPNRGSELLEGNDLRVNGLIDALYGALPAPSPNP